MVSPGGEGGGGRRARDDEGADELTTPPPLFTHAGVGTPKDEDRGIALLSQAAGEGEVESKRMLMQLQSEPRLKVKASLALVAAFEKIHSRADAPAAFEAYLRDGGGEGGAGYG